MVLLPPVHLDDVRAAAQRLAGVVHATPVVTCRALDEATGGSLFLKAENLQRTGAFKFRGAYNCLAQLPADGRGVVTSSAGNHAQAVALAARLQGRDAVIFMPDDAPRTKRVATEGYGATVVEFDRYDDDRDLLVEQYAEREGMTVVHAYDDARIVAGAGTASLELLDQVADLTMLVAPIGGGGMLSGMAVVADALAPAVRVVGVEPAANAPTSRSLAAGSPTAGPVGETIADGQQVPAPGQLNFALVQALVDDVVTVTEREIADAVCTLFERTKLVVEPSGATGLAAVLAGRIDVTGHRVGVMLTGGNLDPARFAAVHAKRHEAGIPT